LRANLFEGFDLLGLELHVLILGELIPLYHVIAIDDDALFDAGVLAASVGSRTSCVAD
jgi:hypothetical protein